MGVHYDDFLLNAVLLMVLQPVVYMGIHVVLCWCATLTAMIWWHSKTAHTLFLIFCASVSAWNGKHSTLQSDLQLLHEACISFLTRWSYPPPPHCSNLWVHSAQCVTAALQMIYPFRDAAVVVRLIVLGLQILALCL